MMSTSVHADPYNFYQVFSGATQISFPHSESAFVSCKDSIGAPVGNRVIQYATYDTANCIFTFDNGNTFLGTPAVFTGSCPGFELFDYRIQQCVAELDIGIGFEELYALIFTAIAFFMVFFGAIFAFTMNRR